MSYIKRFFDGLKVTVGLLFIFQLTLIGCKAEEVSFSAAESTESDFNVILEPTQGQGPVIKIAQSPSDHKLGKKTRVVFEVVKGDFEIASVKCYINKSELSCDWALGIVELVGMPLGLNLFEVVATDVEGLVGKAKEGWDIFDKFKKMSENLKVDGKSKKTDILFVIDNSSSMHYEQTKISQRFGKFVDQISGLDWQLGITTTDPRSSYAWSDGRLHAFRNGDYYLTSAMADSEAQKLFAEHVKRRERGWDTEEGIRGTYRSIERALNPSEKVDHELAKFYRDDAALAVVIVSDENVARSGNKNGGDNLLQLIEDKWGAKKIFQFNSIIVHTKECLRGAGMSMGYAYEKLSKKTNGSVGDICADNYSNLLSHLGKGVADLQKVHKLKCNPIDMNNDGKVDLVIVPKGLKKVPGYTLDKNTITFDKALRQGDYTFHYFCLAE